MTVQQIAWAIRFLGHPTRALVLETVASEWPEGEFSAKCVAGRTGIPVQNVAYHLRTLRDLSLIYPIRVERARGALQRFYVFNPQWDKA